MASGFEGTARRDPELATVPDGAGAGTASSRAEHLLRRAGTGLLFGIFGLGALLIGGVGFPIIALVRRGEEREFAAQRLIQRAFAAFVAFGVALRLFEFRATGAPALRCRPALVVANHPTLLDVVFLISCIPQADCIVKAAAWRNPFLRSVVRIAGYIPNSSGPKVVDACVDRLRAGRSVVIFPEGTRSPLRGLHPFRRGAAHVAIRSGVAMTPVAIRCEPPALKKGQPWWDVPPQKLIFSIEVGPPLRAVDLEQGTATSSSLAAREATASLRRYFEARGLHEGC